MKPSLDKFGLYELCAQSPDYDARMLRAIHGAAPRTPLTLGEDFCGSAAISRAWVALDPAARAVAVDHDAATLECAQSRDPGGGRITYVLADVLVVRDRCDVITVQNFSICELHARPALVAYLKHARARLRRRGVFVCDIYAGADVYFTGRIRRTLTGPRGEKITYTWEHRTTDPLRARVQNAMHFEIRAKGRPIQRFTDAFVYDWRLWSPPELADALLEAGFRAVQFYSRFAGALADDDSFHVLPLEDSNELSDSFNVFVVGRR